MSNLVEWFPHSGDGVSWPITTPSDDKRLNIGVSESFFSGTIPCIYDIRDAYGLNQIVADIRRQGEEIFMWRGRGVYWGTPTQLLTMGHVLIEYFKPEDVITVTRMAELQDRIDSIRIVKGLTAFAWTNDYNAVLTNRIRINRIDLTELRMALQTEYFFGLTRSILGIADRSLVSGNIGNAYSWPFPLGAHPARATTSLLNQNFFLGDNARLGSRAQLTSGGTTHVFGKTSPNLIDGCGLAQLINDFYSSIKQRVLQGFKIPKELPDIDDCDIRYVARALESRGPLGFPSNRYIDGFPPSPHPGMGTEDLFCPQTPPTQGSKFYRSKARFYVNHTDYTQTDLDNATWYDQGSFVETVDPIVEAPGGDAYVGHNVTRTGWPAPDPGAIYYNIVMRSDEDELDTAPLDPGDWALSGIGQNAALFRYEYDIHTRATVDKPGPSGTNAWLSQEADSWIKLYPVVGWESSSSSCSSSSP